MLEGNFSNSSFQLSMGSLKKLVWKIFLVLILALWSTNTFHAQKKQYRLIDVQSKKEITVKDSLSAVNYLDSLSNYRYYFTKLIKVKEEDDFIDIYYDKGKDYNTATVLFQNNIADALKLSNPYVTKNLDSLKKAINTFYIDEGYSFNRVRTKFIDLEGDLPKVSLDVLLNRRRTIDRFVFKKYDKLPKKFVKNLDKEYVGKTYNRKNVSALQKELESNRYFSLEKPPQTLFTKDSTEVFLFLNKKKTNTFDGVLGFGNNEDEKFTFNGSIDVRFKNLFNSFEELALFWQRTPDRGQTFDLKSKIPYLFNTDAGLKVNLNIYRQDTTFANVTFVPALYYQINRKNQLGVRARLESSSVLDSTYVQGVDYGKQGFGFFYRYENPTSIELFQYGSLIQAEADFLNTKYDKEAGKVKQIRYFLTLEHNQNIIGNHYLNFKAEGGLLDSNAPFKRNELFRYGGWYSLRGFNENSLLGNFYYFAGLEYRYLLNDQAFFDVFGQYSQLNNEIINLRPRLYAYGLGFNFTLPLGLMSFQISNGSDTNSSFNFSDTKIHWGIITKF